MTAHVTLTEGERNDVLGFWRDYMLTGGEGSEPSAFQLDALNDEIVRDTFLFWHLGGDPFSDVNGGWGKKPAFKDAMVVLGPVPTDVNKTIGAMTKVVKQVDELGADVDMIDTSTVLVIAHVMMALLLKRWDSAQNLMTDIIGINMMRAQQTGDPILHEGPLEAMGIAASILGAHARQGSSEAFIDAMLKDLFCVQTIPVLADVEN